MITGIVVAVGLGLTVVGGFGSLAMSTELYPNKMLVTLFIIMFLVGMGTLGGGLSANA